MSEEQEKYPEGHFISKWMGIGMIFFTAIFLPLCIATDNMGFIGMGPAIGVSVGLAIGSGIEQKHKRQGLLRPKNAEEKRRTKLAVIIGTIALTCGFIVLLAIFFF